MASVLWKVREQERGLHRFDLPAQDGFLDEAASILSSFQRLLARTNGTFSRRSTSRRKAMWLLLSDTHGVLSDALEALRASRYPTAAATFRMARDTIGLARYLSSNKQANVRDRRRWFSGEVIVPQDDVEANARLTSTPVRHSSEVRALAHRSHRSVLDACTVNRDGRLTHSAMSSQPVVVTPARMASYCGVLADLIRLYGDTILMSRLADHGQVMGVWRRVLGEEVFCAVRTRAGRRCRRFAITPDGRCWQHHHSL